MFVPGDSQLPTEVETKHKTLLRVIHAKLFYSDFPDFKLIMLQKHFELLLPFLK